MKKLLLIFLILSVAALGASAQARRGQFGIQTAVNVPVIPAGASPSGSLGAVYMIADNMAIRAALGFINSGGTTGYDFGGGFEYHFAGKGGVSPYVGGEVGYAGESISGGGTTPSALAINAVFGAQYFFSTNFAWGGEARLGYTSSSNAGTTTTSIGTSEVTLDVTWFLN